MFILIVILPHGGIPIILTDTDSSQTFMTYIDEDKW